MLSFWSSPVRNVSSRREFLRVGGMGLAGLSLSEMLAMKANAWTSRSPLKDKSVIFVFMHGGPSQYETFDPKMGHLRAFEVRLAIPRRHCLEFSLAARLRS